MNNEKEKWIGDVFDSMKGSQRAKPKTDLFAKIQHQLHAPEARLIPINQGRLTAVAAVLLLVINIFVLRQTAPNNAFDTEESSVENIAGQPLLSTYNIYE